MQVLEDDVHCLITMVFQPGADHVYSDGVKFHPGSNMLRTYWSTKRLLRVHQAKWVAA